MTSSAQPRSTPCLKAEDLTRGLIVAAYGRRFLVECGDGITRDCVTRGKRTDYACGDDVAVAVQNDTQGVINNCAQRKSLLYRSDQWKQKLIAANVTQAIIVVAPVPSFDLNVLDCCLAAAGHADIKVLIVLNKAELPEAATSEAVLAPFAALGYPLLKLVARDNIDPLRPQLDGERSVLVGESATYLRQKFDARSPIEIDVQALHPLPQPGCSRLEVKTRQKDVLEKTQRSDKELVYQVSYCRDGRFPDKR